MGAPSDNTTLTEVLAEFADAGFVGEFEVGGGGTTVLCVTCDTETPAADVSQHALRRLEGASDPADMAVVAAVTCPKCDTRGTMVLPFGPNASAAEGKVLAALRDARGGSAGPRNSAPDEPDRAARGESHDVMPGEQAPAFSAPASTGKELSLDDFLGKVPVALTFTGTLSPEATGDVVESFEQNFPRFGQERVQTLLVVPQPVATIRRRRQSGTKVPMLADDDGHLMEMYAASGTFPTTVLIDETGNVTRLVEGGVAADHAAAVLAVAHDTHKR